MERVTDGQLRSLLDILSTLEAIRAITKAALAVPMVGPSVVYPLGWEGPEPKEAALVVPTLPLALRLVREVVAAADGLREQVERVEADTRWPTT